MAQIEKEKAEGEIPHGIFGINNFFSKANKNRRKSTVKDKEKENEVQEDNKKKKRVKVTRIMQINVHMLF